MVVIVFLVFRGLARNIQVNRGALIRLCAIQVKLSRCGALLLAGSLGKGSTTLKKQLKCIDYIHVYLKSLVNVLENVLTRCRDKQIRFHPLEFFK